MVSIDCSATDTYVDTDTCTVCPAYRDPEDPIFWEVPSSTFHRFARLLATRTYTYSVLLGMTVSVGGLTESLVGAHPCFHTFHSFGTTNGNDRETLVLAVNWLTK